MKESEREKEEEVMASYVETLVDSCETHRFHSSLS
jgi:hypothetical protein